MSRLLRALEKAGLVELEASTDNMQQDVLSQTDSTPADSAWSDPGGGAEDSAADEPVPSAASAADHQAGWGRPFEEIYAEHTVRPSPFPAEKLLKLLDGLRMLEASARKAAIMALDAADEAWTIDDALLDAEHKLRALRRSQEQLHAENQALTNRAAEELTQRETEEQERCAQIRKQIADLEALLERELVRSSEDRAAIKNQLQQHQQQMQQEQQRLEHECLRLQELAQVFASNAAST